MTLHVIKVLQHSVVVDTRIVETDTCSIEHLIDRNTMSHGYTHFVHIRDTILIRYIRTYLIITSHQVKA